MISDTIKIQLIQAIVKGTNHDANFYLILTIILTSFICLIGVWHAYEKVEPLLFLGYFIVGLLVIVVSGTFSISTKFSAKDEKALEEHLQVKCVGLKSLDISTKYLRKEKVTEEGYLSFKHLGTGTGYRFVIPVTETYDPILAIREADEIYNSVQTPTDESPRINVIECIYQIKLDDTESTFSKSRRKIIYNATNKFRLLVGINGNMLYSGDDFSYDEALGKILTEEEYDITSQGNIPSSNTKTNIEKVRFTNHLTSQILSDNWNRSYNFILEDGSVKPIILKDPIKIFTATENYILYVNNSPTEIHFIHEPDINVNVENQVTVDTK